MIHDGDLQTDACSVHLCYLCKISCKLNTLLLRAYHACHDLVQSLSLAGLVWEISSLTVSVDLPATE